MGRRAVAADARRSALGAPARGTTEPMPPERTKSLTGSKRANYQTARRLRRPGAHMDLPTSFARFAAVALFLWAALLEPARALTFSASCDRFEVDGDGF